MSSSDIKIQMPAGLKQLYVLLLKHNYRIVGDQHGVCDSKIHKGLQKIEISISGFHDNDPYMFDTQNIMWAYDGTGKDYTVSLIKEAIVEMLKKVMEKNICEHDSFNGDELLHLSASIP